jgi:hypothetical protein
MYREREGGREREREGVRLVTTSPRDRRWYLSYSRGETSLYFDTVVAEPNRVMTRQPPPVFFKNKFMENGFSYSNFKKKFISLTSQNGIN